MATSPKSTSLAPATAPSMFISTKKFEVNSMLQRLMDIGRPGHGITATISENEILEMISAAQQSFSVQSVMLELSAPVMICGDVHGQYNDLIRLFNAIGWPPTVNYLFLGDYIDRGRWSIETIMLLFCIKLKYPDNFLLLRGNHETAIVNQIYGFHEDIIRRFGSARIFNSFQDVFNMMPLSALINDRIICMHGGLAPDMLKDNALDMLRRIPRPQVNPPNPSLVMDLLWADPDTNVKQFKMSIRGVSCTFGPDVVTQFCEKYNIDVIVRAHQVVQDGYEFFANRKLITIFSAPHYCGQFDNAAAVMVVTKDLKCSFKVLRPKFPGHPVKFHKT